VRVEIASRALRDRRRGLVGWALGIAAYMALIVVVWPSIRGSSELTKALHDYPDALKELFGGAESFSFSTAAAYLNAELFSLMVPLLLVVFAIGFGASTLAGEEEHGLLDLVLSQPVARSRVVLEKAFSLVVEVVVLALVVAVTILVVGAFVDLGVGVGNLAAACAGAALVAVCFGVLALFVGAVSGSRATAIGVSAALFAAGYLVQALAGLVDALRPVRWVSPLYLANGSFPVRDGLPLPQDLVLVVVAVALGAASIAVFTRRDLVG